jgi:hypothetical protein
MGGRDAGGITIPDFKLFYRVLVTHSTALAQNRHTDQWSRIEDINKLTQFQPSETVQKC